MGGNQRREPDLCVSLTLPGLESLGQPAASHKGLDCYLDSLFDPVLSCGDAVGMGLLADSRHTRSGAQPGQGVAHLLWVPAGDLAKEEGVLSARGDPD